MQQQHVTKPCSIFCRRGGQFSALELGMMAKFTIYVSLEPYYNWAIQLCKLSGKASAADVGAGTPSKRHIYGVTNARLRCSAHIH
eukprot:scaffold104146_cov38-Prasinocladus_malaysianus.AAC.1